MEKSSAWRFCENEWVCPAGERVPCSQSTTTPASKGIRSRVARGRPRQASKAGDEQAASKKPLRGIMRRISGTARDETFQPVLVEIEDALTPAFIVEEFENDRFVVLVPSVPTPAAGAIYILPRARIHWIDASVTEVVGVITKWGSGTGRLVKAMR